MTGKVTTFYQVTWGDGEHWNITWFTDPREAYRFARRQDQLKGTGHVSVRVVKPSRLVDRTAPA